jgi:tetratricopeptide (TPR) repeat protein
MVSLLFALLATSTLHSPPTAFVHVNVVPMDKMQVLQDYVVVTQDGRITAMGAATKARIPKNAKRIDGRGKYLMPGLVDMHVHLYAQEDFASYLANGVTTVYNLNGRSQHLAWRKAIQEGKLVGPQIFSCGPTVFRCETSAEAVKLVDTAADAGYDSIKIYSGVSDDAFRSLASQAAKRGLMTVGHIPRASGLEGVLKARVPIAHAEEYLYTYLNGKDNVESAIHEAARMTVEAGVPVTATLVMYQHILQQGENLPSLLARPDMKYLSPWERRTWEAGRNDYNNRFNSASAIGGLKNGLAIQKKLILEIHERGGTVLVGTDATSTGSTPGATAIEEVINFRDLGFSDYDALRAATVDSAQVLGSSTRFGSITLGKRADMILLEANPLVDVRNLNRRVGVMAQGRWMTKAELAKRLKAVPGQYKSDFSKGLSILHRAPAGLGTYLAKVDPMNRMSKALLLEDLRKSGKAGFAKFQRMVREKDPRSDLITEDYVNEFGYWLMNAEKNLDLAFVVLEYNAEAHPKSANATDSLAECYLAKGNKAKAIELYQKAVRQDPSFQNPKDMLKKLGVESSGG